MDHSPTERFPGRIPEKFGSGNGANSRKNSSLKSCFPENTCFKREKTVQFRSLRKCAKTGPYGSLSRSPMPPGGRYGPKTNGGHSGTGKPIAFSLKTGRSIHRCCGYIAGRQPGVGIIVRMPVRRPFTDNGLLFTRPWVCPAPSGLWVRHRCGV